jgi:hypothetical protein
MDIADKSRQASGGATYILICGKVCKQTICLRLAQLKTTNVAQATCSLNFEKFKSGILKFQKI